jgi:hypothetical protein
MYARGGKAKSGRPSPFRRAAFAHAFPAVAAIASLGCAMSCWLIWYEIHLPLIDGESIGVATRAGRVSAVFAIVAAVCGCVSFAWKRSTLVASSVALGLMVAVLAGAIRDLDGVGVAKVGVGLKLNGILSALALLAFALAIATSRGLWATRSEVP